jgi:hypothetical protein
MICCLAGLSGSGSLTIEIADFIKEAGKHENYCDIRAFDHDTTERLDWAKISLQVGDELRIRILESESVDEPSWRVPLERRADSPELMEERKAWFREWAKRYRALIRDKKMTFESGALTDNVFSFGQADRLPAHYFSFIG